ncbi:MAG: phenylalanine--tRNA ligase subunit alpha [Clostridiales bacterium]|nr:phenylalanine--tRNA ligase subunit alpha [Clostridiales bacterium]
MKEKLEALKQKALDDLAKVSDAASLEQMRVAYLGKKSELAAILKGMAALTAEERPIIGQLGNSVRTAIEEAFEVAKKHVIELETAKKINAERLDVTLPSKKTDKGNLHPLTKVQAELENIFLGMGFSIAEGPEVETDYYNFTALNTPEFHPARDVQDTFYITDKVLLRSQTSTVQVHVMENNKPPIRIISPGRVYRSDAVDATHSPMFHQCEGLVIDKGITMSDLKGTLETFAKAMFGNKTEIRFRPHHFPFTEPSCEVDVSCFVCGGKGCSVCKGEGWIEILGAGMVHPNVLRMSGIDPEVYSGFAFGMGIERIVMTKYGISDMRLLYENDTRFLSQF